MNLKCPVCGKPLVKKENSLVCENRHTFDFAKSGYVNLFPSSSSSHGDNREMRKARTAFLNTGSYRFLREYLEGVLSKKDGVFLDLGCGEGYYTSAMPQKEKYGFDLSKEMITYASKHDRSTRYIVASIFDLPVFDACADAVLTCFAPCSEAEIQRILKDDGIFVFVSPGRRHLRELKDVLYDTVYDNETEQRFSSLSMVREEVISAPFSLENEMLWNLFLMTPYYYRTGEAGKQRLRDIASMSVTAEFLIRIYTK